MSKLVTDSVSGPAPREHGRETDPERVLVIQLVPTPTLIVLLRHLRERWASARLCTVTALAESVPQLTPETDEVLCTAGLGARETLHRVRTFAPEVVFLAGGADYGLRPSYLKAVLLSRLSRARQRWQWDPATRREISQTRAVAASFPKAARAIWARGGAARDRRARSRARRRSLNTAAGLSAAWQEQLQGAQPGGFARFRPLYDIGPTVGVKDSWAEKLRLVAEIGQADSIRDFGGLWGVHGRYLLEGARALGASYAEMIDVTPREEFDRRARQLESEMPIQVKMLWYDFQDPTLYAKLKPVEVSLLYDVLFHQDNVNFVIKNVAQTTSRVICVAQPVMAEQLFALPNGCVNLQSYPDELKDAIRCPVFWPQEPRVERFITSYWMWGQTISYLTTMFRGYGWDRSHLRVFAVSDYWQYAFMRFTPDGRSDD